MADEQARMSNYLAEDIVGNIDEVRTARGEYDSLDDRLDEIEGGGFTPTEAQLDAMNSTATQAKIDQIQTNKNNILLLNQYGGGKNRLNYSLNILKSLNTVGTWTDNQYERRGITYTVNDDMTITASGTNDGTGDAWLDLSSATTAYSGLYGSGCPSNGSSSTYEIQFGGSGKDYGSGVSIPTGSIAIGIVIRSGATAPTAPFKPMICTSADWALSHDYQPYAMSNSELTADMSEVQTGLGAVCVFRAIKNASATYTYTMTMDDFRVSPSIANCGTYLVNIVNWSTTPTYSLYAVSYSGGNITDYNVVQKIAGADANVTCTNGVISITSSGKVQIYALR